MKKGPFKMKGPGVKAADKISRKPATAVSKTTKAFSNVAKGFSSKAKSAISQLTKSAKNTFVNNAVSGAKQIGNKVGTFNGRDVKFIKRVPGKFARSASKTAMFRGIGKAVPAVGMGLLLKDMYTAGQKRSGGKAVKGQKTNVMGFGKKSIFKK